MKRPFFKFICASSIGLLSTKTIVVLSESQPSTQELAAKPLKPDALSHFGTHIPSIVATSPEHHPQLHSVHIIVRHGARSPLFLLPTETPAEFNATWRPFISLLDDTCNGGSLDHNLKEEKTEDLLAKPIFGQLTDLGQNQSRAVGQMLRSRYIDALHFLPSSVATAIDNSLLSFRSTSTSRTILTAKFILRGLYPEISNDVPDKKSGVIAQGTEKKLELISREWPNENLSPRHRHCGYLRELFHSTKETALWKETFQNIMPQLDMCSKLFGESSNWLSIQDLCQCRWAHGIPLPDGLTNDLFETSKQAGLFGFSQFFIGNPKPMHKLQLSSGLLLSEILKKMETEKCAPKFSVYTGHDSSLIPLLSSLEMYQKPFWPPYCSSVILELWHDKSQGKENPKFSDNDRQWYVRVIFCPGRQGGIACGRLQPCQGNIDDSCISSPTTTVSYTLSLNEFKSKINPLCVDNEDEFARMCKPITCDNPPPHAYHLI